MEKKDYAILLILFENQCFSRLNSMTINEFELDMKPNTIYKKLQDMERNGYISVGIKDGKANTYFITETGRKLLKEEVI